MVRPLLAILVPTRIVVPTRRAAAHPANVLALDGVEVELERAGQHLATVSSKSAFPAPLRKPARKLMRPTTGFLR